ncbi:MAG: M1 family metallopeptidase [Proteobacteria bacterium]|nr:M1 family metallopeptidase [Pseudomonadota bacterium]
MKIRQAAGRLSFLAAGAWIACGAGAAHGQARYRFDATPGFLPKTVVPARYALHFDLDPARDDFTGRAAIELRVRERVDAIVLHAKRLEALDIRLVAAGRAARSLAATADEPTESWRLVASDGKPIAPGRYTLRIAYRGKVNRSDEGLFRVDHKVGDAPVQMLATQLESAYARMLFPGFDEPSFRARFKVEIAAPRGYLVASNMPEQTASPQGDALLHRFAETPAMPTYLVALTVGRLEAVTGRAAGVPLRILVAEGKRDEARYALEVTEQVLPYYVDYFGVPFALPKLDQLAVPGVRGGAMEDWGLISYTEPAILFDPARSSEETRRGVYSVMAHEIAHQWFGDLVTASYWDEIWLNEAFATWMANKATDRRNPAWHVGLHHRFDVDRAMTTDAGAATRAIRSGPVTESSVYEVFDRITYQKGGAVLGMLEQWMGPDRFQRGLAAYIAGRKFSNATAGDLWHYMAGASQQDVAAVAASWTDQQGFPLVRASWRCEAGSTHLTLSQARFRLDRAAPADGAAQRWKIPVRVQRGADAQTLLLDGAEQSLALPGCSDAPLVVNAGSVGYYRVAYAPDQPNAPAARYLELAPADKVALLSDTYALGQAGQLPMGATFALLAQLPKVQDESRPVLYSMAGRVLAFLDEAYAGTPLREPVRAAARALLAPELTRLGWDAKPGEDAELRELRSTLIRRLAYFDDAAVVAEALRRYDLDETRRRPLDASIREAVVQATGMHADRARFDQLLARLKAARGEEDRWIYARALASGRDEARARDLLALALTGALAPNVSVEISGMVAEESPFGDLAYRHVLEHWDQLASLAGIGAFGGRNWLLPSALGASNDAARASQMESDQRAKAGADGNSAAARVAADVRLRAQVKQDGAASLAEVLAGWQPG